MPIRPLLAALLVLLSCTALAPAQFGDEPKVVVSAKPSRPSAAPGDQLAIAVILDHAQGWHTHTNAPVVPKAMGSFQAIPTEIKILTLTGARAGPIQWPPIHQVPVNFGVGGKAVPYGVFEGHAVAFIPIVVDAAAAAPVSITIAVGYQACDDSQCIMPVYPDDPASQFTISLPMGAAQPLTPDPDFAGFDPSVFATMHGSDASSPATPDRSVPASTPTAGTSRFDFFGWEFHVDSGAYILILGIAFLAGIIMNFTPCVLPVVPLKVMSLQQQAKTPGTLTVLSLVYCSGIIATFAVLGLLAFGVLTGGQKFDWGQIFSYGWFSLVMAAIVGAMALGMMGLFTIRLPQAVYMINPSHDSLHGNFLFGVLTAILAVPCTGPLLGATLAWVGTQTPLLGLATFIVMGAGMAFPYALLLAFPRLIDRLPRTGPGSELLKQVLGILMVAVAIFLATNAIDIGGRAWLVGGVASLAWIWAIVGGFRMLRTPAGKTRTAVLAGGMLAITVSATWFMARPGPIDWRRFKNRPDAEIRAAIDTANAEGKTVVVDFTASWCGNCHVIEEVTLNSEVGRQVLGRSDVLPIQVDLSHAGQDEGWGLVREISGGGGIPLIAIFRPGQARPVYFQSFFKASDLEAAVNGPGIAKAGSPPS